MSKKGTALTEDLPTFVVVLRGEIAKTSWPVALE